MNSKPIHIALILPSLANTGPIIVSQQLIIALKHRINFTVYYFDPIYEMDLGVECIQIKFRQKVDFSKFDIIHCHMFRPDLYARWHGLQKKYKVVSTVHQYINASLAFSYGNLISKLFSPVWKWSLKKNAAIITLTKHMAELYQRERLNKEIVPIYNGVALHTPTRDLTNDEEYKEIKACYHIIGSISQLINRKGLSQIIEVLSKDVNLFYIAVGDGPEMPLLKKQAIEAGVSNRVLFVGHIAQAKDYLSLIDVFVMPSLSEGFGLALVEAVAAKVPVVCSSIESFHELFEESEVYFFEINHIDSLLKAIHAAAKDGGKKSDKAFVKYESTYSSNKMGESYLKLYQKVLA